MEITAIEAIVIFLFIQEFIILFGFIDILIKLKLLIASIDNLLSSKR